MKITKEHLVDAISEFISEDMVKEISNNNLKMVASAVTKMAKKSPKIMDGILNNSMIAALLNEKDGMYDVADAHDVIKSVINENGSFVLTVPSIPLILQDGAKLGITNADVDKLFNRISAHSSMN